MNVKSGLTFCKAGIVLLLSLILFVSQAQLNSGNLIQYTEKEGLPGPQVNAILKDKLGYLWIGSVNGLARYDGYEFKRFYYDPNDTASVHGLIIWSLFEDRNGMIWVGSSPNYLNAYNPATKKFHQYTFTNLVSRPSNLELVIRCMAEDNKGRMYFGVDTYYGNEISHTILYKEENEDQVKSFALPDSLDVQNVLRITKDNKGNMWLISYTGLYKIDENRKISRVRLLDDEFVKNNDYSNDIQFDMDNHLWIVTQGSTLYEVNTETKSYERWHADGLYTTTDNSYIRKQIIFAKDGNIWIGTNGGIQFFNRKTGQFSVFNSGAKKELEHSAIIGLCFDGFGTLWAGTLTDGLLKYEERSLLKSYSYNRDDKNSLTAGWADHIIQASDGKIWITTNGSSSYSGVNILDLQNGTLKPIPFSSLKDRTSGFSGIWEYKPGEMYVGDNNFLYSLSEKTLALKPVSLAGIPDTTYFMYHLQDKGGNDWICAFKGLYKKSKTDNEYKHIDLSQFKGSNSTSNEVTRIVESDKHGLWILTNNGLFLYNYTSGQVERHGFDKSKGDIFVTQDINSLYEDAEGTVWVGTWAGGLSRYNVEERKIKTYTRNDGLPSMSIQSIVPDEKNNTLWLSTFEGLSRLNLKTGQFNNFSIADGIQSQLFADGSFLKTSSGSILFGGSNGITIFNPDDINKNSIPPKVFLTDLKIANQPVIPGSNSILKKPVYETNEITLAHSDNNISIEFIALHYSNPSKNRYSYKLDNYDNEWRDIGTQHVAFYPNLPPGEYVFHVKAANDKGVWNEQGATLKITVNPPWWRTAWAYTVYALLFLGAAFAIDRYLRKRVVKKEREKTRARELAQAKEIEKAYHELKATQQQLIQAEKMASLGELTAGIAHEIQNPLNFVNNFSEVNKELLGELNEEIGKGNYEEVKTIANSVTENEEKIIFHGKRADAIVKGMLLHSRNNSGQKELADINALADEYLRLSYHGLRAKDSRSSSNKSFNATLKTDFDESIGNINIVPQEIGRVLLNLINNAFYAVHEKLQQQPDGYEPVVSVSTQKRGNHVVIKISDNGNGIPQKILDKVFQPFFTTKPTGQGTGLGLSLSYDIIKAHGGEITVETKEGGYTTFTIVLPL